MLQVVFRRERPKARFLLCNTLKGGDKRAGVRKTYSISCNTILSLLLPVGNPFPCGFFEGKEGEVLQGRGEKEESPSTQGQQGVSISKKLQRSSSNKSKSVLLLFETPFLKGCFKKKKKTRKN